MQHFLILSQVLLTNQISGFSLTTWLSSNGLADTTELQQQPHLISQLLDETFVAQYLQTPPCDGTQGVYRSSVDGWRSCEYYVKGPIFSLYTDIVMLFDNLKCGSHSYNPAHVFSRKESYMLSSFTSLSKQCPILVSRKLHLLCFQ